MYLLSRMSQVASRHLGGRVKLAAGISSGSSFQGSSDHCTRLIARSLVCCVLSWSALCRKSAPGDRGGSGREGEPVRALFNSF